MRICGMPSGPTCMNGECWSFLFGFQYSFRNWLAKDDTMRSSVDNEEVVIIVRPANVVQRNAPNEPYFCGVGGEAERWGTRLRYPVEIRVPIARSSEGDYSEWYATFVMLYLYGLLPGQKSCPTIGFLPISSGCTSSFGRHSHSEASIRWLSHEGLSYIAFISASHGQMSHPRFQWSPKRPQETIAERWMARSEEHWP